jgi:hypothetical protein
VVTAADNPFKLYLFLYFLYVHNIMTIFKTLLEEGICYHEGINNKMFEYQSLGDWYIFLVRVHQIVVGLYLTKHVVSSCHCKNINIQIGLLFF